MIQLVGIGTAWKTTALGLTFIYKRTIRILQEHTGVYLIVARLVLLAKKWKNPTLGLRRLQRKKCRIENTI